MRTWDSEHVQNVLIAVYISSLCEEGLDAPSGDYQFSLLLSMDCPDNRTALLFQRPFEKIQGSVPGSSF